MNAKAKLITLFVVLALPALALGAVGCGDDDGDDGGGGSSSGGGELSGQKFTVGSKEFTEQLVLGEITKQVLENADADVSDQIGLEGSTAARNALESGDIDMYWEYTGTAWTNYLGNDKPIPDEQGQYDAVKEEDAAENQIDWLDPTPFNDTFALAVRADADEDVNAVETISDLGELANSNPDAATFCLGEEFSTRPDGFPGVSSTYGFEAPQDNISVVGDSIVYQEVADGSRCNFGSVFSTDGRIQSLDLRVLEDDEKFFPFFNAALNVRQEANSPELADLFNPIAAELDDETMTALNAQVDVDGEKPEDVASTFLEENGFTSG